MTIGYSYNMIENALARVFGVDEPFIAPLRARINGLQRNGMTPDKPGRGKVIKYRTEDAYDYALALSLAEFGMTPLVILKQFNLGYFRNKLLPELDKKSPTKESSHQLMLAYSPTLFREDRYGQILPATTWHFWDDGSATISDLALSVALINVSELRRRVDVALAEDC